MRAVLSLTTAVLCSLPLSRKKFEIATGEAHNPIHQDVKNGLLREYGWVP